MLHKCGSHKSVYASSVFAAALHSAAMSDEAQLITEIRAWLERMLKEHVGLTAPSWAKRAGVAASTVQRALKPDYPFMTSSRTLAKLATAIGEQPPQIGPTRALQIVGSFLAVRFRVQAGLWYEVDSEEPIEQISYPVVPDPRYAEWPQWLELVVGDSANKKIPDGHYAHVVDAIEMGYMPKPKHWVVVERQRDQGRIRERTIKQVGEVKFVEIDGVDHLRAELWPRSTNPRWSEPIQIGVDGDEGVEARIVGLVIGAYDPDF